MIGVSIACALLFLLGAGYRLAWRRRYGPPLRAAGIARVRGRVLEIEQEPALDSSGTAPPQTILLHHGVHAWPVRVGGRAQATIHLGDRITVDGVWTQVLGDRCYREASGREVVEALRVRAGAWPALRWLPLPCGLLGAGAIAALLAAAPNDELPRLYQATAAQLSCPRGSKLASSPRTSRGWMHWCRDARGRFDGPLAAWSTRGEPLVRKSYRNDRQHGRWTEHYPDGRIRRDRVFLDGARHGRESEWWRQGSSVQRGLCKSDQSRDEEWSPDPLTPVRRSWYRGTAHGLFEVPSSPLGPASNDIFCSQPHPASGCPPPDPCLLRDRRTFWHGLAHGPVRQWPKEGGTRDGWLWLGRHHSLWWRTPGLAMEHYLYGYPLLNPEAPDPRLQSLLESARRLQRGFEGALAEWEQMLAPGASPAALPPSSLHCEKTPRSEGCRDERGRQGLWVLEPGLDEVIYVDGLPVASCGVHGSFFPARHFEGACTWLELPKDGGPPSWWRWRRDGLPLRARADLGILTLEPAQPGAHAPRGALPGLRLGRPTTQGGLDPEAVLGVVRQRSNELRYNFQTELCARPDLAGRVVVHLMVAATGQVVHSQVLRSTLRARNVEEHIARSFRRWLFPRPREGELAFVTMAVAWGAAPTLDWGEEGAWIGRARPGLGGAVSVALDSAELDLEQLAARLSPSVRSLAGRCARELEAVPPAPDSTRVASIELRAEHHRDGRLSEVELSDGEVPEGLLRCLASELERWRLLPRPRRQLIHLQLALRLRSEHKDRDR